MCVDNYGVLIHLLVGGFFGYTYYLRDQALKREARLRDLFREIDADGSGRIDYQELRHALVEMERRKLAPHRCPHHAKQLFDRNAITEGSQKHLSFSGFVVARRAGEPERSHQWDAVQGRRRRGQRNEPGDVRQGRRHQVAGDADCRQGRHVAPPAEERRDLQFQAAAAPPGDRVGAAARLDRVV
jgi:hypothetical protein